MAKQMATTRDKATAPDASEFGQLRAELAKRGVQQADITRAIGATVNGRSRAAIVAALRDWCRALPKANP